MRRLATALSFTALVLLAACGGAGPPLPRAPADDLLPRAEDLRDALTEMARADAEALLARRLYEYGLTPPFEDRFALASGPVVALVPGRHPAWREELVVVAAEAGTPGAAALVEEARLLAARAAFTTAPERTVLVAFLPPGAGPLGLAAVLDAPVWRRPLVAAALVVGNGGAGYEAVGVARGVPVTSVTAPAAEQRAVAEALALGPPLRAALTAATSGAPAAPDAGIAPADSVRDGGMPVGG